MKPKATSEFTQIAFRVLAGMLAIVMSSVGILLAVHAFTDTDEWYRWIGVGLGQLSFAWGLGAYALDVRGPLNWTKLPKQ
jgi:hypothetical protein